jgi:hypothetical protein
MLVGFVSKSNYFVYSTVVIYFTMLYTRRFGKMTFNLSVAGVRFMVKGLNRVGMRIRGEVVESLVGNIVTSPLSLTLIPSQTSPSLVVSKSFSPLTIVSSPG